jgi:MazG nucleotide pyrophosphohydrolase domain
MSTDFKDFFCLEETNSLPVPAPDNLLASYQAEALKTAVFPEALALHYLPLGIMSEVGEMADVIKKAIRKNQQYLTSDQCSELCAELGDVLWYAAVIDFYLFGPYAQTQVFTINKPLFDNSLTNLSFIGTVIAIDTLEFVKLTSIAAQVNPLANLPLKRADQVFYPECFYLRIARLVAEMVSHLKVNDFTSALSCPITIEKVLGYNLYKLNNRSKTNSLIEHD